MKSQLELMLEAIHDDKLLEFKYSTFEFAEGVGDKSREKSLLDSLQAIRTNKSLITLDLAGVNFNRWKGCFETVCKILRQHKSLQILNLSNCILSDAQFAELQMIGKESKLKHINLEGLQVVVRRAPTLTLHNASNLNDIPPSNQAIFNEWKKLCGEPDEFVSLESVRTALERRKITTVTLNRLIEHKIPKFDKDVDVQCANDIQAITILPGRLVALGYGHDFVTILKRTSEAKVDMQKPDKQLGGPSNEQVARTNALTVSPNGLLISGDSNGKVKVWEWSRSRYLKKMRISNNEVLSLDCSSQSGFVAVGCLSEIYIYNWHANKDSPDCLIQLNKGVTTSEVYSLKFLSNDILASGHNGKIKIWDVEKKRCLRTLEGHNNIVRTLAILPSGNLVSIGDDQIIKIWDWERGICIKDIHDKSLISRAFAILPTGHIMCGTMDGHVKIWDYESGKCVHVVQNVHHGAVIYLKVLANHEVVSCGLDSTIRFWKSLPITSLSMQQKLAVLSAVYDRECLNSLDVSMTDFTEWQKGWEVVVEILKSHQLSALNLNECTLSDHQYQELKDVLQETNSDGIESRQTRIFCPKLNIRVTNHAAFVFESKHSKLLTTDRSFKKISRDQIHFQDILYSGEFFVIHRAVWAGSAVAVKELKVDPVSAGSVKSFKLEVELMSQCNSPRVARMYAICAEDGYYAIIMEYLAKGSLFRVIHEKNKDLPWMPQRWQIAIDVTAGLHYLHSNGLIHGNINSNTILLDEDYRAKIADFGLSNYSNSVAPMNRNANIGGLAPELSDPDQKNSEQSDVYSLGMVLWELAERRIPFDGKDEQRIFALKQRGKHERISNNCLDAFKPHIESCWQLAPNRPTAEELLTSLTRDFMLSQDVRNIFSKRPWKAVTPSPTLSEEPMEYDANEEDIKRVLWCYQYYSVPDKEIAEVKVIHCPRLERIFKENLGALHERSSSSSFKPTWKDDVESDSEKEHRRKVNKLNEALSSVYRDEDYPKVRLLPVWHGTNSSNLPSIYRVGFDNLATTDAGFFGKGIYGAIEAQYAYKAYSKGALLLSWFSFYSAYPVIGNDQVKLWGGAKHNNYDAHFVPVCPASESAAELTFNALQVGEYSQYHEVVVFAAAQALPRYRVTLKDRVIHKAPAMLNRNPYKFFLPQRNNIDLCHAAQYVYDNFLSKPYKHDGNKADWTFTCKIFDTTEVTIPRPNHALAHTLRTVSYVPYIVEFYLKAQVDRLDNQQKKQLIEHIPLIQLAMMFYVVGRENEYGFNEKSDEYSRFREKSMRAYIDYVTSFKVQIESRYIEQYARMIKQGFYEPEVSIFNDVLCICHDLDLIRCYDRATFRANPSKKIASYLNKKGRVDLSLVTLVELCLEQTGDRNMGGTDSQLHRDSYQTLKGQAKRFVECSQSVASCFHHIDTAIQMWINKYTLKFTYINQPVTEQEAFAHAKSGNDLVIMKF